MDSAMEVVRKFFDETLLLQYDSVHFQNSKSFSAVDPLFWQKVDEGIAQNREVLGRFVGELEESGVGGVQDLKSLSQGYQSKLLHIIAHFLDGFIGIDTVFYNLPDDSHWLAEESRQSILAKPDHFWLIHVDTAFVDRNVASFI